MSNYNDGKWHGWDGGECPVHTESVIEYLWNGSSGVHHEKNIKAGECLSAFTTTGKYYMIAFRIIREHRESREWWILHGKIYGYNCDPSAIHVREVIE